MKWILVLAGLAGLFWWFFVRDSGDCGCTEHKDTINKKTGGCGCSKTNNPQVSPEATATVGTLKSNFIYDEPASNPNGELERALFDDEQMLLEKGTYKSAFGDEGDAGESETYE